MAGIGPKEYLLNENVLNVEQKKDLTSPGRRRLGDYLVSRTVGGAEKFTPPIQGGGEYTYMPPRGNAYPVQQEVILDSQADASRKMPGQFATDLSAFEGNPDMKKVVKIVPSAGRSSEGESGNTVLNSTPIVKKAVSDVLKKNRFSSGDNKFTSKSYNDAMPPSPAIVTQNGDSLEFKNQNAFDVMRKAAIASMLNAAGGSSGPGKEGMFSPKDITSSGPNALNVINPLNVSQLGISKIDSNNMRVAADKHAASAPNRSLEYIEGDTASVAADFETAFSNTDLSGADEAKYTKMSYGQLNTYLEQFSGAGTANMALLAITAYISLFVAVAAVSLIISAIIGKLPKPDAQNSTLSLGAQRGPDFGTFLFDSIGESSAQDFLSNLGNIISKVLGVMQPYEGPAVVSYFLAAIEGALAVIGVNVDQINNNPASVLTDALPKILINFGLTPGYYLTIIREIARDLSLLVGGEIGSGVLGAIESIRSLKIVRFVDTCARLGIVSAQSRQRDISVNPDLPASTGYAVPQGGDISSPATLFSDVYDTAQKRVSRSRETLGSRRLSWSHSSLGYTRSELVTKDLLRSLSQEKVNDIESGVSSLRMTRSRKVFAPSATPGRISKEDKDYHEQLLDAEYMPFYFHDLRTNEILSFHAFLSALTDSFTANYTSVEGFGRMDPVQIYKNTTRAITFTFNVVSTNPDDHQQMWYSVNKLVNMVYPQWSDGDTIAGSDGSVYTQPFSQTITSSPMVRVRIGDVIHSNYSRFALGRIFGLDKAGAKLTDQSNEKIVDLSSVNDDQIKAIESATSKQATSNSNSAKKSSLSIDDLNTNYQINVGNDIISTSAFNIISKISSPERIKLPQTSLMLYETELDAVNRNNGIKLKRSLEKNEAVIVATAQTEKSNKTNPTSYIIAKLDVPQRVNQFLGGEKIYSYAIAPYDVASIAKSDSFVSIQAIKDFMSPETNPIVKSFEDGSGGRGLAGFVTSLAIDYGNTETTWNVERGSRAPNMASIAISFTPVHDIPMGLGADGTSRSIAYPVGEATRRRFTPELAEQDNKIRGSK